MPFDISNFFLDRVQYGMELISTTAARGNICIYWKLWMIGKSPAAHYCIIPCPGLE